MLKFNSGVSVHEHISLYTYFGTCQDTYAYTHCLHTCLHTSLRTCLQTCPHTSVHKSCTQVCVDVDTSVCAPVHTSVYTPLCAPVRAPVYTPVYTTVYSPVYMHVHTGLSTTGFTFDSPDVSFLSVTNTATTAGYRSIATPSHMTTRMPARMFTHRLSEHHNLRAQLWSKQVHACV